MAKKEKRTHKEVKCPYCESTNVAKYVYGLVDLHSDILFDDKIVLGGCIIEEDVSPKYMCNNCEKDFGIYCRSKRKVTNEN